MEDIKKEAVEQAASLDINEEEEISESLDLSNDILSRTQFSLSEEQSKNPVVLCTVEGVGMGPFGEENRNVRQYSVEVAKEGILNSSYVKEMLKCKTLLGEPHHPSERSEVWCNEASHSITDMWLSEDEKYLMIRMDILDTPNGRVLKSLVDYGCTLGVSARASGKTKKEKGKIIVIPESYNFRTFDVVTNPGFKEARVSVMNEGVEENSKVKESLERMLESNDIETLKSVGSFIKYFDDKEIQSLSPILESKLASLDNSNEEKENGVINMMLEEKNRLAGELSDLEEENQSLVQQADDSYHEYISMKQKYDDLYNRFCFMESKERKIRSDTNKNEGLAEEVKFLKAKNAQLVETQNELMESLRESWSEITALKEDLHKKDAEYSELMESFNQLENDLNAEGVGIEAKIRKVGISGIVQNRTQAMVNEGQCNERTVTLIKRIGGK